MIGRNFKFANYLSQGSSKCLLHNNFIGTYLSRYNNSDSQSINRKLATIDPKLKETILNLFSRTRNCELSMPLPLGAISLAIDINQKLATINPKLNGMINQSQIKGDNPLPDYQTGNDYSFEVSGKD